jgi:hypothetical protein
MTKFANFAKGVHGIDLPKFEDKKEGEKLYWQYATGYVTNPKHSSLK